MQHTVVCLVIASIILLSGCHSEKQKETMSTPTKTYLALGDSYTIGEAVEEPKRWPVELVKRLNEKGHDVEQPKIIAKTGWTTDELQKAIDAENISETYDIVSLLIGVNNQYRGEAKGYDTATYRMEFASLLNQAIAFANHNPENVFVVSIPDYGVTPFVKEEDRERIANELAIYNAINKEESEKADVMYFDITPTSKKALTDSTLVAEDNLHPSGKMYALWVDVIEPTLNQKLGL